MSFNVYKIGNFYEKYKEIKQNEFNKLKLLTGFEAIDKYTEGLQNRQVFFLAARPGVGKTTFLQNIILNVSKQLSENDYILFLSLELSIFDIYKRFLQIESKKLNKSDIENFYPSTEISNELLRVKEEFSKKNILIFDNDENKNINPLFIENLIEDLNSKNLKIRAIFIDYFQLLDSNLINSVEYKAQEDTSRKLKQIAKMYDINIFCLAQLSREYEKRKTLIPTFSDLKGTSSIEQDADVVMFLYTQDLNIQNNKPILDLSLTLAKNRNGLCNTSSFLFDTVNASFFEKDNFAIIQK
ncbi:DnaB-like helicase C-terminal domain-containing protein [Mycoplasma sp. 332]|uniref:DnaB-like helicase C-terminal domain-containing protein n=1 Tax=Mycoplasma sp. 332 TaxID=3458236 RepID=UPI0040351AC1